MTLHEVSRQLYSLSVNGYFNGEKFTLQQLENRIACCWRGGQPKLGNRIVMQIALPDGWWYFTVNKYRDGYDYTIPETREQESRIVDLLFG